MKAQRYLCLNLHLIMGVFAKRSLACFLGNAVKATR
jgi:hypothetical protein